MAGTPKRMSQVKQLLKMHSQGIGIKTIARNLGISKNTVKSYLNKINSDSLSVQELLNLEDPELEARLFSGNPAYKQERYQGFKQQLPYYVKELKRTGVTRHLLWEEYKETSPDGYGYTQFCYHLRQYEKSQNPSAVLQHHPGDKLYIDFAGKPLCYYDRQTGEQIKVQVFVSTLPYSDYSFAIAVRSQKIEDFIHALTACIKAMGGVPQTIVPDNLKAAVIKTDRYEPTLNQALEDFSNHYGTTITPARAAKPKDKSLVEDKVSLLYTRVYAKLRNNTFFDLSSLNSAITQKVKDHNQTRMQRKEYCREEKFLADEKHTLAPLPEKDFEIKYYKEYKVAQNNHIYMSKDRHYYSVPYTYIGKKVKVIYTRSIVRIYSKGILIANHPRSYKKASYSTQKEHLCSHHQYYLRRSPEYYMQRAYKHSEALYQYIKALFEQDKYPEQLYKSCEGILNLAKKTNPLSFTKACTIALENKQYSYGFLKRILENKTFNNIEDTNEKPLPKHQNIRGSSSYK